MTKQTSGARSALEAAVTVHPATIGRAKELGRSRTAAQRAANRWQRVGRAIVLQNGPMTREHQWDIALANAGPRAVLTAFTAAEAWGLAGWERDEVHLLVPGGARIRRIDGLAVRVHRVGDWSALDRHPLRRLHRIAPAFVRAAGTFRQPRPACGILAAGVQQRLTTTDALLAALHRAPRVRHRAQLRLAVHDIAQVHGLCPRSTSYGSAAAARFPLPSSSASDRTRLAAGATSMRAGAGPMAASSSPR